MVLFVVLCLGAHEGSTGGGSDFKASQKMGPQLKVSSDRQMHFKKFISYSTVLHFSNLYFEQLKFQINSGHTDNFYK